MMHYFALTLLFTPISHARAIVANTTLFDLDLHGNAKKLAEMKTMAFNVAGNETVHSRSMRLLKELVPDQDAVRTNLTRKQTDAIVDIVFRTPVIVNQTECQVFQHLPLKQCGGSNHTDTERLSEEVRVLQASCESGMSALVGSQVEKGARACFDVNLPTNSSCADNSIACLRGLRGTDMRVTTQIQEVLHGPALTKRSEHTSASGSLDVSNSTELVVHTMYKRATPPKELDNARKAVLWTGIIEILGVVAAIVIFVLGVFLGYGFGALAIALAVLGVVATGIAANSEFNVYHMLGRAQKDIQGRTDISNTTEVAPTKPPYCWAAPIFKGCQ